MASFRAKLHGLDSWANMRLAGNGPCEPDILRGLFTGTTMKVLLEMIMGKPMRKMTSFDGISKMQKLSRADWFIQGLKEVGFLPMGHAVETEFFISAFGKQVFPVLWNVVNYDLKYCWCACPDMLSSKPAILLAAPFRFMDGAKPYPTVQTPVGLTRVDRAVKPDAETCVLSMARSMLKRTREGSRMTIEDLQDFADCRILCALINAFAPEMLMSELMLNDRWTLNLIVKSLKTLLQTVPVFDSQDFAGGDEMGLCSFLSVFFTKGFQLRQSLAVITKLEHYQKKLNDTQKELRLLPATPRSTAEINKKGSLSEVVGACQKEIDALSSKFNVEQCREWSDAVEQLQVEIREEVTEKVRQRFDLVDIEDEDLTINEFVDALGINLSLTGGVGFYATESREVIYPGRRLVVQDTATGDFYDNFTGYQHTDGRTVYSLLGVNGHAVSDIRSDLLQGCKVFYESLTRNRILQQGSQFLYQVFPGTRKNAQRLCLNAAKLGNSELLKKLTVFYNFDVAFINGQDGSTGNTALHLAARHGHEELVLYLLENGASVNVRNSFGNTPLLLGAEKLSKPICQLLLEWGADARAKNIVSQTVLDTVVNADLRSLIQQYSTYYDRLRSSLSVDACTRHPAKCHEVLQKCLQQHANPDDPMKFVHLHTRCVSGLTLLHIAAAVNDVKSAKALLANAVAADVLDSRDRIPLHCCTGVEVIELLLNSGAPTDQLDRDGNSPLHSLCNLRPFPSQLQCIKALVDAGGDPLLRNDASLMPVHCCARQGNTDAIELLLETEKSETKLALFEEDGERPWSLVHLALDKLYFDCAEWLTSQGLTLKTAELNALLLDAFSRPYKTADLMRVVKFVLDHNDTWAVSVPLDRGNTILHLACGDANNCKLVELLLNCDINVGLVNREGRTALHFACEANAPSIASKLIDKGADVQARDKRGVTPLDVVSDYKDWVSCGYFEASVIDRLQAHDMKHSRELVRSITSSIRRRDRSLSLQPGMGGVPDLQTLRKHMATSMRGQDVHQPAAASRRRTLPSIKLSRPTPGPQYGDSVAERIGMSPLPTNSSARSRSLSAPATVSSTRLPPLRQLKPSSRQVMKSVVGI